MKQTIPGTVFVLFLGLSVFGCKEEQSKIILPEPTITINKIWVDGVAFDPVDTISLSSASEVKMEYTVNASAKLLSVDDYYVYGTTGSKLVSHLDSVEIQNYKDTLVCNDFMPFRCGFRVVALDNYGGATSAGFYLKLPANGLGDITGGTTISNSGDKKFGVVQNKFFWSYKRSGRYTNTDVATSTTYLKQADLGYRYINGKHYLISLSEWNTLVPNYLIKFPTGSTVDDIPVTKFMRIGRFTSSMWNDLSNNNRLLYLSGSMNPTATSIEVTSAGQYYFYKKNVMVIPLDPAIQVADCGVIYVKSLTTGEATNEININAKAIKY